MLAEFSFSRVIGPRGSAGCARGHPQFPAKWASAGGSQLRQGEKVRRAREGVESVGLVRMPGAGKGAREVL